MRACTSLAPSARGFSLTDMREDGVDGSFMAVTRAIGDPDEVVGEN